jgi:hypothetical protein
MRKRSPEGETPATFGGTLKNVMTVLALCVAFAAPALVLGTLFALPQWIAAIVEAHRRWQRKTGRLLAPAGPPLERLAADLRRLRSQRMDPYRSRVQREGARLAYEDVLRETAAALGIAHELSGTRAGSRGFAKEVELLRLEQAIFDAGLVLSAR